jgi:hypothetical protein
MKQVIRAAALALSLPLSCSDEPEDYSDCGAPLDPTMTYPTYSEEFAELVPQACEYFSITRGECSDGKRFLSWGGGFGGSTLYYRGELFVGGVEVTDVTDCSTPCPFTSFVGTLETVRCESAQAEQVCQPNPAPTAEEGLQPASGPIAPFADGRPWTTREEACSF